MAATDGAVELAKVNVDDNPRISMGPSVSLIHVWSESASATTALVGARLAFYGGP